MDLVDRSSLIWYKLCVPGFVPKVKIAARNLARRQQALRLVGEGKPITEVAREMHLSPYGVRKILHKALASESLYPNTLGPEQVAALRQVQAQILANSRQRAIETHATVAARMGTKAERGMDATASARLLEAVVRAVDLESNLFGTKQPLRVIEEQLRVSYQKTETKVRITFDRSPIEALARQPVPGLTITANGNGNVLALDSTHLDSGLDRLDVPAVESAPESGPETLLASVASNVSDAND